MKRTRAEYDKAIALLYSTAYPHEEKIPAIDLMRELRDSAFALEEALVYLKEKAEMVLDAEGNELIRYGVPLSMGVCRAAVTLVAAAATAPAPSPSLHQSEKIMGTGVPEKFTGPSGGLPDASYSTPEV